MKLYLAAMYQHMDQINKERVKFIMAGHIVTSRWLDGTEDHMSLAEAAAMDLDDIDAADALVSYTLPKGTMFSSGGRHVEFGYAIARDKRLFTIGEVENIFHNLGTVTVLSSTEELIALLYKEKIRDAS